MNNKYLIIALTLVLLGINHKTQATPVSASLEFHAEAVLSKFDGVTETSHVIDSQSTSWGTLLAPLNVNVNATATDANQILTVSGDASATWGADGNSGSVSFHDFGFSGNAHNYTADLRNGFGENIWSYRFIADSDGFFTMTYDVSVIDAIGVFGPFGLSGWDITWSGGGGSLFLSDAFDPTANGVFSRPIVANQLYQVGLSGGPSEASGSSENNEFSKHVQGNFNFTISPVPEPSAFVLLLLGLVTLKILHRRWN